MIKRGAYKLCKLISGSAFIFFALQSCNANDNTNYGSGSSKPATDSNNDKTPVQVRDSEVRESQKSTANKEASKSKRAESPKRTGCMG